MADPEQQAAAGPPACAPCRGTGQVVSNLGGDATLMTCPWCEGAGVQLAGHDAQLARRVASAAPQG